jgi:sulfite reductase beta subunit-like hemoprotein
MRGCQHFSFCNREPIAVKAARLVQDPKYLSVQSGIFADLNVIVSDHLFLFRVWVGGGAGLKKCTDETKAPKLFHTHSFCRLKI